jgi:hypothetical protein
MPLSAVSLQAKLALWAAKKPTFPDAKASSLELANQYHAWALNALAGGSPVLSSSKSLISAPLVALPPIGVSPNGWAGALEQGLIAYWTAMTFAPLAGPVSVAAGVPPQAGPFMAALLAQMVGSFLSPGANDALVVTTLSALMFNMIGTIKAQVGAPTPFLVGIT